MSKKLDKSAILSMLAEDKDIMAILSLIRDLNLKDAWLCAGSLRNFIWNALSHQPPFDRETDVDVIFFDPQVSYGETLVLESKLRQDFPHYKWELKNQVYMHIHSPQTQPYQSSRDAMSKYPERCTALGLRLLENGELDFFAPYGLEDVLTFQVYPTPHFLENEERKQLYLERLAKKNWQDKWPHLSFHKA